MLFNNITLLTILLVNIIFLKRVSAPVINEENYFKTLFKVTEYFDGHEIFYISHVKGIFKNYRKGGKIPGSDVVIPDYIDRYAEKMFENLIPINEGSPAMTPLQYCSTREDQEKCKDDLKQFIESDDYVRHAFLMKSIDSFTVGRRGIRNFVLQTI